MPEPIAERLSRFTPDGTGLDRDALLFSAGRASVRPNRTWTALAWLFGVTQVVTLLLLWPRPVSSPNQVTVDPVPTEHVAPPESARAPTGSELWALYRRLDAGKDDLPPPTPVDSVVPAEPAIRPFAYSSSLLE